MITETPNYLMIDIETLSKRIDAAVFAIAVVHSSGSGFMHLIDLSDQSGRRDDNTIMWWLKIGGAPWIKEAKQRDTLSKNQIHGKLLQIYQHTQPHHVWFKGKEFDIPRLANLFGIEHDEFPWEYNETRDIRDAADLYPYKLKNDEPHNPEYDCRTYMPAIDYWYRLRAMRSTLAGIVLGNGTAAESAAEHGKTE